MTRLYLFVDSPVEADFLRRVLPQEVLNDVELIDAYPIDGIASLARTVLVRRKKPVAVLMDADSNEPDVIEERQQSLEELIQAADGSAPAKVISAVPSVEAWLFAAPEAIERVLGEKIPEMLVALGKRDPKGVLQQLAQQVKTTWDTTQAIQALDAHDIARICAVPEMVELKTFLHEMQPTDSTV